MSTLAFSVYLDTAIGVPRRLELAGTALDNPTVYQAAVQEFLLLARQGRVEILGQPQGLGASQVATDRLMFKRLR